MKNNRYLYFALLIFVLLICIKKSKAQAPENFPGALTHENYFKNPKAYLASLDSTEMGSKILIDRVIFGNEVLSINGRDKVTTIEYPDFYQVYQQLKEAQLKNLIFPDFDSLIEFSKLIYESSKVNIISILDFDFYQIKSSSLENGQFLQNENGLSFSEFTNDVFQKHRAVSLSCFKHNLFGNEVKFMVHDFFTYSNQKHKRLDQIEIDFGNGSGFVPVQLGEEVTANYATEGDYIELKLKLTYFDSLTNQIESVYAHNTLYRKGTEGIQEASLFFSEEIENKKNTKGQIVDFPQVLSEEPDVALLYYPEKKTVNFCTFNYNKLFCGTRLEAEPYTLEYSILFNSANNSDKLRRPLIMCDGFDPENKRNYYNWVRDNPHKLLEKDKDFRGLFEILNGNKNHWADPNLPDANLISYLQNDGYDIVFINFFEGAGDVNLNAIRLRGFLNEIINAKYRDNKTEEAIFVGPSMGGLISRLALTEMEKVGEEHYIKTWVSFDSPHTGANIPIAAQELSEVLNGFLDDGGKLELIAKKAVVKTESNLKKLGSTAARQMLYYHFSNSNSESRLILPSNNFVDLQQKLKNAGFPQICKNYAITNGGNSIAYPETNPQIGRYGEELLDKEFPNLALYDIDLYRPEFNKVGQQLIAIKVKNRFGQESEVYSFSHGGTSLALDNAPGGFHTALYSFNKDTKNRHKELDQYGDRFDKACFIPTTSCFGIPLNPDNMHYTWDKFTNCNDNTSGKIKTPFDDIFGMSGKNEEHVWISAATRDEVLNAWFRPDFYNSYHPVIRTGNPIHHTASKAVAYVNKESVTFAGNNNSFTFKSTADANIVAGKTIKFSPGFKVEKGAKVDARIESIPENNYILKRQKTTTSKVPNYLKDSPYLQKVYDYSQSEGIMVDKTPLNLEIYPNPAENITYLSCKGVSQNGNIQVEVYDVTGKLTYIEQTKQFEQFPLNTQTWQKGIYIVKIKSNGKTTQQKLIKL